MSSYLKRLEAEMAALPNDEIIEMGRRLLPPTTPHTHLGLLSRRGRQAYTLAQQKAEKYDALVHTYNETRDSITPEKCRKIFRRLTKLSADSDFLVALTIRERQELSMKDPLMDPEKDVYVRRDFAVFVEDVKKVGARDGLMEESEEEEGPPVVSQEGGNKERKYH